MNDESNVENNKPKSIQRYLPIALVLILLLAVVLYLVFRNIALKNDLTTMSEELSFVKASLDTEINKNGSKEENETVPVITSTTIKDQLSGMSELVTQEYTYRNADRRESSETWIFGWTRPFSSKSILITYDGTIKAGIDFSMIDVSVDEDEYVITIDVPDSEITDNYIDQGSIQVLEVKNGLFNEVTFDNYNEFVSDQKEVMREKAIEHGILEKANEEAANLVKNFISVIPGIENYQINIE